MNFVEATKVASAFVTLVIGGAALANLATPSAAATVGAATDYRVGTLTCAVEPAVGLVLGSVRQAACAFQPAGASRADDFRVTLTSDGFEVGIAGPQQLTFAVHAPTPKIRARDLVGTFGGPSLDATVVVGPGTHAMMRGGEAGRIALEPVAVSGEAGPDVGFGTGVLSLSLAQAGSPVVAAR